MASSSCSRSQASLLLKRWRTSSPHCRIPPHPPPPTPVHHGAVTASVTFTPPVQRRFMSDHSSATGMRPSGKIFYIYVLRGQRHRALARWARSSFTKLCSRPVVPGCAGCAIAHPDFGRSVNPISTRGDRLCPPNYYWHILIFRPSDGPLNSWK